MMDYYNNLITAKEKIEAAIANAADGSTMQVLETISAMLTTLIENKEP